MRILDPNYSLTAPVIPPKPKPRLTLLKGGKDNDGLPRVRKENR